MIFRSTLFNIIIRKWLFKILPYLFPGEKAYTNISEDGSEKFSKSYSLDESGVSEEDATETDTVVGKSCYKFLQTKNRPTLMSAD